MKSKLMKLKLTVRTRTLETCVGELVASRRVTNLELMQSRMRRVIWLQNPTISGIGGEKNFTHVLNLHGVNVVRQNKKKITAEPLVPELARFVV